MRGVRYRVKEVIIPRRRRCEFFFCLTRLRYLASLSVNKIPCSFSRNQMPLSVILRISFYFFLSNFRQDERVLSCISFKNSSIRFHLVSQNSNVFLFIEYFGLKAIWFIAFAQTRRKHRFANLTPTIFFSLFGYLL